MWRLHNKKSRQFNYRDFFVVIFKEENNIILVFQQSPFQKLNRS